MSIRKVKLEIRPDDITQCVAGRHQDFFESMDGPVRVFLGTDGSAFVIDNGNTYLQIDHLEVSFHWLGKPTKLVSVMTDDGSRAVTWESDGASLFDQLDVKSMEWRFEKDWRPSLTISSLMVK